MVGAGLRRPHRRHPRLPRRSRQGGHRPHPGRLVRDARTQEAKRLLAKTDLTVRQVALRVGFDDPSYFCRFFRRETGLSPGDFRRGAEGGRDKHHDHRIPSLARPAGRA